MSERDDTCVDLLHEWRGSYDDRNVSIRLHIGYDW
jgi:hypothetical protein